VFGVHRDVTPQELAHYLRLVQEIGRLESELKAAIKQKHALAKTLYERHGRDASYKVGDQYLMVAPTRIGTYYFVPRVRWPSEARAAKSEKKRLDRIARLQQRPKRMPEQNKAAESQIPVRRIEVTATLSRGAQGLDEPKDVRKETHGDGLGNLVGSATLTHEDLGRPIPSPTPLERGWGECGSVAPSVAQDHPPMVEARHTPAFFTAKHRLPIVGDVEQPSQVEPRLLHIREPPALDLEDLDP
jgi:hypothetical protein